MERRAIVLLAAWGAMIAKVICAAATLGTNDVDSFYNFGRFIWERGLLAQYRATAEFNHTPLVGWFCAAIYGIGHGFAFNLLLRLPGVLADFFAVCVLLRWNRGEERLPAWGLLLFALSPVNFMVSGYHGNVDSVLAWLVLLAARECVRERPVWCALLFGLACQVKIIPLLLAPAFFFFWLHRGRGRVFLLTASAAILAGWAVPLIFLPGTFLHQVLGYGSNWGSWGVTWLLRMTGWESVAQGGFQNLTPVQVAIVTCLKVVIVTTALWIAWRRRSLPAAEVPRTVMITWAVFFVFAAGVGGQYLVWFAPVLLLVSARWYAVVTAASAVFLFAFYTTISGGLPWYHGVSTGELLSQWVAWSALPWVTFVAFLIATAAARSKLSPK